MPYARAPPLTRDDWAFYDRREELDRLCEILRRRRWFFLEVSGATADREDEAPRGIEFAPDPIRLAFGVQILLEWRDQRPTFSVRMAANEGSLALELGSDNLDDRNLSMTEAH